jgi:phenylacetate-CoA ligase
MEKSIYQLPIKVLARRYFYDRSQHWNEERLKKYQIEKLKRLFIHCEKNVPYYQKLFREIDFNPNRFSSLNDLLRIPTLSKETVRRDPESFLADNAMKCGITWDSTSGSTGTPLHFVLSDAVQANKIAALLRCFHWAGYRFGMKTFCVQSYYFQDADFKFSKIYNILRFDSNRLKKESALEAVKAINKFKPKFFMGFPFDLLMIARFAAESGITIVSPKSILTYGETLSQKKREKLEEMYHCPVFNFHSMHECSAMIGQCEHGKLHLIEDFAFHEIQEDSGKLIGTSYYNYSMPLIRYEIGDQVKTDGNQSYSCGRPFRVVKEILGKSCDYIQTADGRILGAVMSHSIDNAKGVVCSQIIQEEIESLKVKIITDNKFDEKSQNELEKGLRKRLGNEMKIQFEKVNALEKRPSGKTPFILSRIGNKYE